MLKKSVAENLVKKELKTIKFILSSQAKLLKSLSVLTKKILEAQAQCRNVPDTTGEHTLVIEKICARLQFLQVALKSLVVTWKIAWNFRSLISYSMYFDEPAQNLNYSADSYSCLCSDLNEKVLSITREILGILNKAEFENKDAIDTYLSEDLQKLLLELECNTNYCLCRTDGITIPDFRFLCHSDSPSYMYYT